jgi:hypothetical protein
MEPTPFTHPGDPADESLDVPRTMPLVGGDHVAAEVRGSDEPDKPK